MYNDEEGLLNDNLNIGKLIEVAEAAIDNSRALGDFARGEHPVCDDFRINGRLYRLAITLTSMDVVHEQRARMKPYRGID